AGDVQPVPYLEAKADPAVLAAGAEAVGFHLYVHDVRVGSRHLRRDLPEHSAIRPYLELAIDPEQAVRLLGPLHPDPSIRILLALPVGGLAAEAVQGEAVSAAQVADAGIARDRMAAGRLGDGPLLGALGEDGGGVWQER